MRIAMPLLAVASLTLTACIGAPGEVDEQTGTTRDAITTSNAVVANAVVANAVVANAVVANAVVANELTSNELTSNAVVANSLQDPDTREFFTYLVGCALPASETVTVTVDGTTYSFDGELGLASEWGKPHGHCDNSCQEWVSACLLARVDYLGQKRDISIRGQHPALQVSASEAAEYTNREATYFGNLFTAPWPQQRFACLSPGQTEIPRVCGPTLAGCVVDVDPAVSCKQVCGHPNPDGAFPNCRPDDGDWDDLFPYHGSITVFLKP